MAKVSIQLAQSIEIGKVDCTLEVAGVGRLIFSKGTVEWLSSPKSVNHRTFTWKQFRKVLEEAGKPMKKPLAKKGPLAKKKPAVKSKTVAKPVRKQA